MGVHIIATQDEKGGYNTVIPENPNVTANAKDESEIIPKTAAAKEQDEKTRKQKTAVFRDHFTVRFKSGIRIDIAE